MRTQYLAVAVISSGFLISPFSYAIHKCLDENGTVTFSNVPCATGKIKQKPTYTIPRNAGNNKLAIIVDNEGVITLTPELNTHLSSRKNGDGIEFDAFVVKNRVLGKPILKEKFTYFCTAYDSNSFKDLEFYYDLGTILEKKESVTFSSYVSCSVVSIPRGTKKVMEKYIKFGELPVIANSTISDDRYYSVITNHGDVIFYY